MATSRSSKKRIRQHERRRLRHKARKTELKTLQKRVATALGGTDAKKAAEELKVLQKRLDKAADGHTIHKNTAARRKSRLQRKLNKLAKGGGAAPAKS